MVRQGILIALSTALLAAADIPQGAHLLLRMQNTINTKTAKAGDYVYLQTATPLAANGAILIPVGTYVQGVVALAERAGRIKGKAQLGVKLETFTFPDGRVLRLSPRVDSVDGNTVGQKVKDNEGTLEGGSGSGRDATMIAVLTGSGAQIGAMTGGIVNRSAGGVVRGIGIGAGIGAAAGAVASLVTRGPDAVLAQGTSVDIAFDQAVPLE